ncbi:DUF2530 domain-containing protein [Herbidospora daliensis]|uniref:DUF2530 domain-containing protein n=1 Tax=Herbidospora daliensis TaxID=295585 RepID=UPI000A0131AC
MTQQRRPDPEPLKTNDSATITVGIVLWAIALIVLLIVRPDQSWYSWTCVAGIGMGFFGLWFVRRRDRKVRTSASAEASRNPAPPGSP